MSLFSIFSKKQPEATSVADVLAGSVDVNSNKSKKQNTENRHNDVQSEQLVPEKKRARRRLIGAVAMVFAVVIGLPMVLDSQPKVPNKELIIQIPSKETTLASLDPREQLVADNKIGSTSATNTATKPSTISAASAPTSTTSTSSSNAITPVKTSETPSQIETHTAIKNTSDAQGNSDNATANKPKLNANDAVVDIKKSSDKNQKESNNRNLEQADKKTTDDTARANAILNGKFNEKNGSGNFEVQIGAYSKPETVNELQIKLSGAGIKSHTQKIATTTGEVIRLRVGPFNSKESAEKAKAQIEKLGISAKIIPS